MSVIVASRDCEKALRVATLKAGGKSKGAVLCRHSPDDNCSLRINKNAQPTCLLPRIIRAQK